MPTYFSTEQIASFSSPESIKTAFQALHAAGTASSYLGRPEDYSTRDWKKIWNLFWLVTEVNIVKNSDRLNINLANNSTGARTHYYALRYNNLWHFCHFDLRNGAYTSDQIMLDNNLTNYLFGVSPRSVTRNTFSKYINFISYTMPQFFREIGMTINNTSSAYDNILTRSITLRSRFVSTRVEARENIRPIPLRQEPNATHRLETIHSWGSRELIDRFERFSRYEGPHLLNNYQDHILFTYHTTTQNSSQPTLQSREMPESSNSLTPRERELQRNWEEQRRAISIEIDNARNSNGRSIDYIYGNNFRPYINNAVSHHPNRQSIITDRNYSTMLESAISVSQHYYARMNGHARSYSNLQTGLNVMAADHLVSNGFFFEENNVYTYVWKYKRTTLERAFAVGNNGPRQNRTRIVREINERVTQINRVLETFGARLSTSMVAHVSGQVRIFMLTGMPANNSSYTIGQSPLASIRNRAIENPIPMPDWFRQPLTAMSSMFSILSEGYVAPGTVMAVSDGYIDSVEMTFVQEPQEQAPIVETATETANRNSNELIHAIERLQEALGEGLPLPVISTPANTVVRPYPGQPITDTPPLPPAPPAPRFAAELETRLRREGVTTGGSVARPLEVSALGIEQSQQENEDLSIEPSHSSLPRQPEITVHGQQVSSVEPPVSFERIQSDMRNRLLQYNYDRLHDLVSFNSDIVDQIYASVVSRRTRD